ncbi:MAG: hypothetical protein MPJ24_04840 [Pirellulaceae bacterium]|nr:hypothetical protein [Pirellulaceae bacterium]
MPVPNLEKIDFNVTGHYQYTEAGPPVLLTDRDSYELYKDCSLTKEQQEALLSMKNLRYLCLTLTDHDCPTIAQHQSLEELDLTDTIVTAKGIRELLKSKSLKTIRWNSYLSPEAGPELKALAIKVGIKIID